ncbi:MAG: NADH-quinone oxidoreductase subunit J [Acidobacteriota bacterium]
MTDLLFWPLAVLLVAGALGTVLSRSLYRAAYCLAGTLVVTAVFYLMLTSPLLAAVQILLYTGGVLTLVVFALVMTAQSDDPHPFRKPLPAVLVATLVFAALGSTAMHLSAAAPASGLENGTSIGIDLFSRYVVPFELLSVLLLGAIFGALMVARRDTP